VEKMEKNSQSDAEGLVRKKVVMMGLDDGGKTSIVLCLKGIKNLKSFVLLSPTRGINIDTFEALNSEFTIWDFGGQEEFRITHLENLENHIFGAEKVIFVIDIQDSKRYDLALGFLKKIVDLLTTIEVKIDFSIFLHKWDPDLDLQHKKIEDTKVNELIAKIKNLIPSDLFYKFQKTSIYTVFQKSDI
jgi:GTPase SAR1 family protein